MIYSGEYLFPPRTNSKIPYDSVALKLWKSYTDSICQLKLNGNRNLIQVAPDRSVKFWNRHKNLQQYAIPNNIKESILNISPAGVWTCWDSELLEFKTTQVKDLVYIYDCLVWGSKFLMGRTYYDRYSICEDSLWGVYGNKRYLDIDNPVSGVYLAENFTVDKWDNLWDKLQNYNYIEGLVLKRLDSASKLEPCSSKVNNSGFMCRVRKPCKNLLF